jgi:ech hydrogenase subunit A
MNDLLFLMVFPFLAAVVLLASPSDRVRSAVVKIAALIIVIGSIYLLIPYLYAGTVFFDFPAEPASLLMFIIEMGLALYILYLGVRARKVLAILLILAQTGLVIYYEYFLAHTVHMVNNLFIDQFSLIMALIVGVIGSLICVYATRYMDTYHHHHPEVRDRRNYFFFLFFVFLASMFGLVFSNNLLWIFFFWEITTICSFLLIGYAETEEAVNNAFLALVMNLLGGIAFAGALIFIVVSSPGNTAPLELSGLLASGQALVLVPAVLISFAGITKAALMPFSSWLVGAMVAPTPVSALLHSSTMVKAGVYIIVRFSPVLGGTVEGLAIGLVGGFTFLLASAIAVSQSNAKKVLAYSTIANLGLIVACAGVGTYKLVWAAIFLILFHAIAKSLLFLCVGTVEHRMQSKDIEDMGGLIVAMPRVATMMFIGIAGMFLAPFGMLISKWAAIEGFVSAPFGLIFIAILAFGGGITVFFWSKWMGKIISVVPGKEVVEHDVRHEKWLVLYALTALVVVVSLGFPIISSALVVPYVYGIFGQAALLSQDNVIIMLLMITLLLIMPLSLFYYRKTWRYAPPYMGGRTTTPGMQFAGSMGVERQATLRNYYITAYFGEEKVRMIGTAICTGLIVFAGVLALGVLI